MKAIQLFSIVPLIVSIGALAEPTQYPGKDSNIARVKNSTSSSILADHLNPNQFYVMPPTAGKASPGNFSGSANMGMCAEISQVQQTSRRMASRMEESSKNIEALQPEVKAKATAYHQANEDAEAIKTSSSIPHVEELKEQLDDMDTRLDTLRADLDTCGDPSESSCKVLKEQIKELQATQKTTRAEYLVARKSARVDYQNYNRAKAKADAKKEEYDDVMKINDNLLDQLVRAKTLFMDLYKDLGRLEGGSANISYESGWDDNITKVRQENNGSGFVFDHLETDKTSVNANFIGAATQDSYLASLPAILDYSVNGQSYQPWGVDKKQTSGSVPDKMQASLRLSLVGACPIAHPADFDLEKDQTGIPVFGVSANYMYPVRFKSSVKFTYNLSKIYDQIQKSASSSSFFHPSSWSSMSETEKDLGGFKAEWIESDPSQALPASEKKVIEDQVKAELMERVLKEIATPIYDGGSTPVAAPPIPESGAMVIAKGLEKECGWYSFYCTGASWLLRGASSIFGSSTSESDFHKQHDAEETDFRSSDTTTYKAGTTVFVKS